MKVNKRFYLVFDDNETNNHQHLFTISVIYTFFTYTLIPLLIQSTQHVNNDKRPNNLT